MNNPVDIYPTKFFDNEVSCVFATDDNYAPYLSVAIQSILENASSNNNYGIYILEEDLSDKLKYKLKLLERDNLKIEFVNTKKFIDQYRNIFHLHSYVTIATYYRFFITQLFEKFDKVVYLDCDLIINCDIANLYNIDLENHYAACVRDIQICSWYYKNLIKTQDINYYLNTLELDQVDNYFNAGVMVFDLNKLREYKCTEKSINLLKKIKKPKFSDQCILNSVLKDKVLYIDFKWNFQNIIANKKYSIDDYKNIIDTKYTDELLRAIKTPQIVHYICIKPWEDLDIINGEYFWKYARKNPFYETIVKQSIITELKKEKSKLSYKNFMQRIFSIKNLEIKKQKQKIITIMGVQISYKRNKK